MLKTIRQQRKISQAKLAEKSHVAQSLISDIENGNVKNPGIQTMRQIAKALDVSIDELLDDDDGAAS